MDDQHQLQVLLPECAPPQTTHAQAQGSPAPVNGAAHAISSANGALNGIQAASASPNGGLEPYVPQQPKGSFLSNALRRLSSNSQASPSPKVYPNGGVCPRRVLNIDPNRTRCLVPELQGSKLRKVAFCVDVEIAGGPRYKDDVDADDKKKKKKDKKLKERGEGEALKHPNAVAEEKERDSVVANGHEALGSEKDPNPEGNHGGRREARNEQKEGEEETLRGRAQRTEREET